MANTITPIRVPEKVSKAPTPMRGAAGSWVPRTCACGGAGGAGGECAECRKKRLSRFSGVPTVRENSAGVSGGAAMRPPQFGHNFDRISVAPRRLRAGGLGEGRGNPPTTIQTNTFQAAAATDPTGVHFSNSAQIFHTPACGSQTIQAIAEPAGMAGITWSLSAGTAAIAAGTAIDAAGNITLGGSQVGGTIKASATSGSGAAAEAEVELHSHPTGIASTSVAGSPPDAANNYGATFDHVFKSNDGNVASLENVGVGERFPNVPNPEAASHSLTGTPFGNGTFALQTATLTPGATNNWFLTSAGGLNGTQDRVTIGHDGIDIGQHIASASNPTPANPLPAAFSVQQDLHWFCPAAAANARWNNFISLQHERRLRLAASGPEVVVTVNNIPQVDAYVGLTGVRNARATPATVVRSASRQTASTVQIAADALPSDRSLHFSIRSAHALGCTINAATGVLTVGTTAGQIVVRVANRAGGPNFDEVTVTITDPPATGAPPVPPPPGAKSTSTETPVVEPPEE